VVFASGADSATFIGIACLGCLLYVPRTLITIIFQITGNTRSYAAVTIMERGTLLLGIGTVLLFGGRNVGLFVAVDVVAKLLALLLALFLGRQVFATRPVVSRATWSVFWMDCRAGLFVLVANLAAILINGVARWVIVRRWDIVTFGQTSLAFQFASFFMVLVNAVSISVFPNLKRIPRSEYPGAYLSLRRNLITPVTLALVLYFPVAWILRLWLPGYTIAVEALALLFPLCVYESISRGLAGVFMKAERGERTLMWINLAAFGSAAVLSLAAAYLWHSLSLTVLSILVSMVLRAMLCEWWVARVIGVPLWRNWAFETLIVSLFIASRLTITAKTPLLIVFGVTLICYTAVQFRSSQTQGTSVEKGSN
jgi:hypothetical protein